MEDQDSQTETVSLSSEKSNTKNLFKTFQELYTEQVKGTDESFDGLKVTHMLLCTMLYQLNPFKSLTYILTRPIIC